MHVWIIVLDGTAWWYLEEKGPAKFPLGSRPGWSLLNPLLYPHVRLNESLARHNVFHGPRENRRAAVIASNILCLESPLPKQGFEFLDNELAWMLRQLRYVSRYARFPRTWQSAGVEEVDEETLFETCLASDRKSGAIGGFNLDAAITEEMIQGFAQLAADYKPPVYAELLLDAIEAHSLSDFKKSILYATIAAETLAATILDEHYKRVLARQPSISQYLVVELSDSAGGVRRCDPVYDALRTSPRSQMRRLLHELPLYVLGRSLLVENKVLYDSIVSLYKARNEIAHLGESEVHGYSWSSGYKPTADAIRSVARLFEWFGESGRYPVLDQMVMLG